MMNSAANGENDFRFCQERVARTRPLFLLSSQFAPAECRGSLLALYALLASIEDSVSRTSDPDVAQSRLVWLRSEWFRPPATGTAHPVLRQLGARVERDQIPADLIEEEFSLARRRLDREVVRDSEELTDFCERIGRNQLGLERAVVGDVSSAGGEPVHFLRGNGLMQIFREGLRSPRLGCWWLPMNLSARTGVSRDAVLLEMDLHAARVVTRSVSDLAKSWNKAALPQGAGAERSGANGANPHWRVYSQLQSRKLKHLTGHDTSSLEEWLGTVRPLDAIIAWRTSRKFAR